MAAIKEILEFEADRTDRMMQRAIHLFQEGSFYRAYEWSAWLMCRNLHEFKVTHRRMKGIEQSVTLIGFPVTSLSKWATDGIERHDVSDKHLVLTENFADSVRWQLQKVSAEKEKLSADTLRLLGGVRLWQ